MKECFAPLRICLEAHIMCYASKYTTHYTHYASCNQLSARKQQHKRSYDRVDMCAPSLRDVITFIVLIIHILASNMNGCAIRVLYILQHLKNILIHFLQNIHQTVICSYHTYICIYMCVYICTHIYFFCFYLLIHLY